MLTDIFSSFDPATSSLFAYLPSPIFWTLTTLNLLTVAANFWMAPGRLSWAISSTISVMMEQMSRTTGIHLKGISTLIIPVFILIILVNLTGLIPYVFSTTSHLLFSLSFGLPLWLALIISGASKHPYSFMASLLPGGAPDWLNPFLVLIETMSIAVRPITLSFRLAANMSAGHIILGLIGIYAASALFTSATSAMALISIQIIYVMFEMGVCLIQAYIFCLLLSLYSDDHPTH